MRFRTVTTLMAMLAAAPAFAGDFYAGWQVGSSIRANTFASNGGVFNYEGKDAAFKVLAGYEVVKDIAIEAAYTDLGGSEYTYSYGNLANGRGSVAGTAVSLSGVFRIPFGKAAFFSRLGAVKTETTKTERAYEYTTLIESKEKTTTTTLLSGLGLEYQLTTNGRARIEWEQYGTPKYKSRNGNEVKVPTSMVSIGVTVGF
jgi:hypothetical protein